MGWVRAKLRRLGYQSDHAPSLHLDRLRARDVFVPIVAQNEARGAIHLCSLVVTETGAERARYLINVNRVVRARMHDAPPKLCRVAALGGRSSAEPPNH